MAWQKVAYICLMENRLIKYFEQDMNLDDKQVEIIKSKETVYFIYHLLLENIRLLDF